MTVQFVEIAGQKMAILPVAEFEQLVDLAEDKLDVAAATAAEHRREDGEEYVPAEVLDRIIAGENRLRVWRQHRGLTLVELATKVRVSHSFISQLETVPEKDARRKVWRALAAALDVTVDEIMPE